MTYLYIRDIMYLDKEVDKQAIKKEIKIMSGKRKIYGVSSKFNFGEWEHYVVVFDNMEAAQKWLHTEEYDSRERELMTKTAAIKLAGRKSVENPIDWEQNSNVLF